MEPATTNQLQSIPFVAVHVGAGYHSPSKAEIYKKACREACNKAITLMKQGKSATEAVTEAVIILEDYPCTNAGIGSCLTMEGVVECDASIMDGKTLGFGAVGALTGIKNPIRVANSLLEEESKGLLSLGRIPPCFLTGEGANRWAKDHGIEGIDSKDLITDSSLSAFRKYKHKLNTVAARNDQSLQNAKSKKRKTETNSTNKDGEASENLLDTVGAICIDCHGYISSGVSSGGLALKQPGRVGQAAVYGCGCWAVNQTSSHQSPVSAACSTTGCGEHLLKSMLARRCTEAVVTAENTTQSISHVFKQDFLESPFLASVSSKQGGAIVVRSDDCQTELVWAHTTDSMCIGYMSADDQKPKTRMSRLPESGVAGKSLALEGIAAKVR